jgi:hypothetical protein
MKSIGKKLKGYFAMSMVQFNSGYITVRGGAPLLVGFTDSDWAGDPGDRKSTAVRLSQVRIQFCTMSQRKVETFGHNFDLQIMCQMCSFGWTWKFS